MTRTYRATYEKCGIRDRIAALKLLVDACDRGLDEKTDLVTKAFELSQRLEEKWVTADGAAKRKILEILRLNLKLDGVSLVFTMRKPFDLLAEGLLLKNNRSDNTPIELFRAGILSLDPLITQFILAA